VAKERSAFETRERGLDRRGQRKEWDKLTKAEQIHGSVRLVGEIAKGWAVSVSGRSRCLLFL
jgi:hypothetical protein